MIKRPWNAWECTPDIRAWCAHVTVTPELIRIKVFKKGTSKALKTKIPWGGQTLPIAVVGANLLWKNAQKNLRKKKISEIINNPIPQRKPNSTIEVCNPCTAPSEEISFHHWNLIITKAVKLINKRKILDWWNHLVSPIVRFKAAVADNRGHGDSSTKWYGCRIKFDICLIKIPLHLQRNALN